MTQQHIRPRNTRETTPTWRTRLRLTHRALQTHPTGAVVLKIAVGALGGLVVLVGLLLVPLPGPGWLIVISGLGIWSLEFAWARRLTRFTREKVRGWTHWARRRSAPVRALIGAAALLLLAATAALTLSVSLGYNVVGSAWDHLTAR